MPFVAINPKPLWRLSVTTSAEAEEAVSEMLVEVCGRAVASYTDLETGQTTVTAYFDHKPADFATMRARLVAGMCLVGLASPPAPSRSAHASPSENGAGEDASLTIKCGVSLSRVRREDWAESWKRHFSPLEIGSRLLIRPSWSRRRPKNGQADVVLDPGLSFGTGQHPTTAFCLEQIVARRRPGRAQSFLDVGTGSGILAIAAAKLGYAPVDALDIEPDAVLTARRNARLNRVAGRIRIQRQDFRQAAARGARIYAVACANLVSNMLVEEREKLRARVEPGGLLVLAGILATEFAQVQKVYETAGCRLVASRKQNEWRSGAFEVVEGR
jgi:ribosomal protein L11 methyltransferase